MFGKRLLSSVVLVALALIFLLAGSVCKPTQTQIREAQGCA